jgi:hemerythrin-like domain-containing protein
MTKGDAVLPTASLREEHATLMTRVQALAERVETLHEQTTMDQLSLAREVIDFVRRQVAPHAHAEEYTLYPAADWAAGGDGSKLTEAVRFEHVLVGRRTEALEKAVGAGAAPGKLMHLCYGILGLVAAHFVVTEEVVLPYLDEKFDMARFEKEVLTPLRETRKTKR